MMILMNWAEVRRWRDIVNPGSVNEVRPFVHTFLPQFLSHCVASYTFFHALVGARAALAPMTWRNFAELDRLLRISTRTPSSRARATSAPALRSATRAASGSTRSTTPPPPTTCARSPLCSRSRTFSPTSCVAALPNCQASPAPCAPACPPLPHPAPFPASSRLPRPSFPPLS